MLLAALERAGNGELPTEDGRNIIGLANQISNSMNAEVKVMTMNLKMGHQTEKFGDLSVC